MLRNVLFDMDGVIANFVGGVLRAWGKTLPIRDVQLEFGLQVGFGPWSDPDTWKALDVPGFWEGLEILPDGMDLFRRVHATLGRDRIAFLSDGSRDGAPEGKRRWLDQHLPGFRSEAIFARAKHKIASNELVLVDDYEPHVKKWREKGPAILVPRPWNSRKPETDENGNFDVTKLYDEIFNASWT